MGFIMDDQNYVNQQNEGSGNGQSGNYYQDYTASTQQYQAPPQQTRPEGANGFQIASLILGILGILGCCCYGVVGLLFGIIGLILALIGNKRNRSGIGIGGLVCSIIAILFGIIGTIYFALVFMGLAGEGPLAGMYDQYWEMLRDMGINMDDLYNY